MNATAFRERMNLAIAKRSASAARGSADRARATVDDLGRTILGGSRAAKATPVPVAGMRRARVYAQIVREARREFPNLRAELAVAAFAVTPRGAALHAAYVAADPDSTAPPVAKALPEDSSASLSMLRAMGDRIAAEQGVDAAVGFARALQTDEGRELHAQYVSEQGDV